MKGYKPGITKKDIEAHKRTNEKVRRTDTMNKALEKAKGGKKLPNILDRKKRSAPANNLDNYKPFPH